MRKYYSEKHVKVIKNKIIKNANKFGFATREMEQIAANGLIFKIVKESILETKNEDLINFMYENKSSITYGFAFDDTERISKISISFPLRRGEYTHLDIEIKIKNNVC